MRQWKKGVWIKCDDVAKRRRPNQEIASFFSEKKNVVVLLLLRLILAFREETVDSVFCGLLPDLEWLGCMVMRFRKNFSWMSEVDDFFYPCLHHYRPFLIDASGVKLTKRPLEQGRQEHN